MSEKISDNESSKDNTRNSICCHKRQVHFFYIIWLHNGMLIDEHARKQDNPYPVQPSKCTRYSGRNNAGCTQQVQGFGNP